jgi:hypothetical protein
MAGNACDMGVCVLAVVLLPAQVEACAAGRRDRHAAQQCCGRGGNQAAGGPGSRADQSKVGS